MPLRESLRSIARGQADSARQYQRVMGESQWASQLNPQESQFLRGTGNITQAGDFNPSTTRFWLSLSPAQSFQLLMAYLGAELGEINVRADEQTLTIRVAKPAGSRTVSGTFVLRPSEGLAADGYGQVGGEQTAVNMRRGKGSILHWRAFWWTVVRDQRIETHIIKGDT